MSDTGGLGICAGALCFAIYHRLVGMLFDFESEDFCSRRSAHLSELQRHALCVLVQCDSLANGSSSRVQRGLRNSDERRGVCATSNLKDNLRVVSGHIEQVVSDPSEPIRLQVRAAAVEASLKHRLDRRAI